MRRALARSGAILDEIAARRRTDRRATLAHHHHGNVEREPALHLGAELGAEDSGADRKVRLELVAVLEAYQLLLRREPEVAVRSMHTATINQLERVAVV